MSGLLPGRHTAQGGAVDTPRDIGDQLAEAEAAGYEDLPPQPPAAGDPSTVEPYDPAQPVAPGP
jgi:hypothetical protein